MGSPVEQLFAGEGGLPLQHRGQRVGGQRRQLHLQAAHGGRARRAIGVPCVPGRLLGVVMHACCMYMHMHMHMHIQPQPCNMHRTCNMHACTAHHVHATCMHARAHRVGSTPRNGACMHGIACMALHAWHCMHACACTSGRLLGTVLTPRA